MNNNKQKYVTIRSKYNSFNFTKREGLAHKITLAPPLFIEVPVSNQECERWRICVFMEIYCASFYDFDIDIGTVPTVWYFF
jgi:hypothetical protein